MHSSIFSETTLQLRNKQRTLPKRTNITKIIIQANEIRLPAAYMRNYEKQGTVRLL